MEGYRAINGAGGEEDLSPKRTVGKTILILQGIGVDAPSWKEIEQQDPSLTVMGINVTHPKAFELPDDLLPNPEPTS